MLWLNKQNVTGECIYLIYEYNIWIYNWFCQANYEREKKTSVNNPSQQMILKTMWLYFEALLRRIQQILHESTYFTCIWFFISQMVASGWSVYKYINCITAWLLYGRCLSFLWQRTLSRVNQVLKKKHA